MKTIKNVVLGFALVAGMVSCTKDDDQAAPVSPVSVEFAEDFSVMEQNGKIDIPIKFNKPANLNGFIIVKVSTEDEVLFETTPAVTAGEIVIDVTKGSSSALIEFTPQDDQILTGERTVILEISNESEGFIPAAKKSLNVTITDNEMAAVANFLAPIFAVEEDSGEETEIKIWLSVPAPGEGSISILLDRDISEYFNTNPPFENNQLDLAVDKGKQEVAFKVIPKNNSKIDFHQNFTFSIDQTSGVVSKGEILNLQLTVLDDEMQGKAKSSTTVTEDGIITKTWEYDTAGRIAKIREEVNEEQLLITDYSYHYDDAGKLANISTFTGNWENFKWENGKVVQTEIIEGFMKKSYSNYDYDLTGNITKKTSYDLNDDQTASWEYSYYDNGDIKVIRHYLPGEGGQEILVSTITYESYKENLNPFPLQILPTVVSQRHLPYFYRVVENGDNEIYYYYVYEFGFGDQVVKSQSNFESTTYTYY